MPKIPKTLWNGKVRTSTLILVVVFVAVLVLYLTVRPIQEGSTVTSPTQLQPSPSQTPVPIEPPGASAK